LKPSHFRDGYIHLDQFKTMDPVIIPIHATVQRIIDKYNGTLPKSISNQKSNDFLKEMGKMVPCLSLTVSKTVTKAGLSVTTNYSKWELISTHAARRSFATNEYLAGTPAISIMGVTGHRTEKSFLRYIKLTPNEHAKLMKMHWDKRAELANNLKAV
jgi:integrase